MIIEDTALLFAAYGGLPGPYIKAFLDKLGLENLAKMAAGLGDNTAATAQTIFALHHGNKFKGEKTKLFVGQAKGKIVPPRGDRAFGWDPVFLPDGYAKTFGEMAPEEKNKISHRAQALAKLVEYLKGLRPPVKPAEENEEAPPALHKKGIEAPPEMKKKGSKDETELNRG